MKYSEEAVRLVAREVARVVRDCGVAAIPTDTSYGLAADATRRECVLRVFEAKGRAPGKAVSIFVPDKEYVFENFSIPAYAVPLVEALPMSLTLVLRPLRRFPPEVESPMGVGVRLPPHPLPPLVARLSGTPVTATSANVSGKPPAYSPGEVLVLSGIDLLVDAGPLPRRPTSTVIVLGEEPCVLRVGAVDAEEVEAILGRGLGPCPATVSG